MILTAHCVFALMIAVARATLVRARQRALVRPEAPNSPEFTSKRRSSPPQISSSIALQRSSQAVSIGKDQQPVLD
jgi:hypothetical protein